ncbi:histone-lysine N-methyltransferase ATXR6 [Iris pallida]|uniref:Histone-lysine N-methyltransferase ATXR6 n=1 Tax=Iris pallida TaxID=29817 RepID=A0AAX6IHP2_IRIPA|nr:histone-lysine N-methyltransferase ATXR6 [Iris pallida]
MLLANKNQSSCGWKFGQSNELTQFGNNYRFGLKGRINKFCYRFLFLVQTSLGLDRLLDVITNKDLFLLLGVPIYKKTFTKWEICYLCLHKTTHFCYS